MPFPPDSIDSATRPTDEPGKGWLVAREPNGTDGEGGVRYGPRNHVATPPPPLEARAISATSSSSIVRSTPSSGEHPLHQVLTTGLEGLFRFIHVRVGGNRETAEDLLQETAEIALAHQRTPADVVQCEAWVRGIAKNLVRRHWRTGGNGSGARGGSGSSELVDWLEQGTVESVDQLLLHQESLQRLAEAVTELSSEEQWLIMAFYRQGRTRAEIATELGVTAKSVETRLYRVRARLRALLSEA